MPSVVLVAIALSACGSGDGGGDDEQASRPSTTDEGTSTTSAERATTTVAAQGPAEWVEVARDVEERRMALAREPNPEAIATLYSEDCSCWAAETDPIRQLAELGHHLEGEPRTVLAVWHWGTDQHGFEDVTVKLLAHPLREVDAEGTLVQELSVSGDPICIAFTWLPDGPGQRYRVHQATRTPTCPDEGG